MWKTHRSTYGTLCTVSNTSNIFKHTFQVILLSFRVVKQALRSSGANVTEKHIRDVSMCALFLLEAAKKCDTVFKVSKQSTAHTIRDANADILKIQAMLLEKNIVTEDVTRTQPGFVDPTVSGIDTLTKGDWLEKHLASKVEENLQIEERGEVDIDFELDM